MYLSRCRIHRCSSPYKFCSNLLSIGKCFYILTDLRIINDQPNEIDKIFGNNLDMKMTWAILPIMSHAQFSKCGINTSAKDVNICIRIQFKYYIIMTSLFEHRIQNIQHIYREHDMQHTISNQYKQIDIMNQI